MKVYIVSHGYDYEGSIVVKVFSKEEDAVIYVLSRPPEAEECDNGSNIEHKMEEHPNNGGNRYFSNNWGEYYTINEHEVLG